MSTLLLFITEVALHFGSSCGIVHVGLMIHSGQIYEALIHTIAICVCILIFAATMFVALKFIKPSDKQ